MEAETITQIGLLVNLCMAILKAVGGWLFHSDALVTDAFHSATDLVADIVTLVTIFFSRRQKSSIQHNSSKPSSSTATGIWTPETLGALVVSGFIFSGGIGMGWKGLNDLYQIYYPSTSSGFMSNDEPEIPDPLAAVVAAASIAAKEWLYRKTLSIAASNPSQSAILTSNALHHRIDALSSVVALFAIVGAFAVPAAAPWLDPAGAVVIAGMVIKAGVDNVVETLWGDEEEEKGHGLKLNGNGNVSQINGNGAAAVGGKKNKKR